MEKNIEKQLQKKEYLQKLNCQKKLLLEQTRLRRSFLIDEKQNGYIAFLENSIAQRVKNALNGTLDCADRLAQNNGKVKYLIDEIRQYKGRSQQLQGQIEALKFEFRCHRKRKSEWQQKLFKIKQNILNETLKTKDIKTKLNQLDKRLQNQYQNNQ